MCGDLGLNVRVSLVNKDYRGANIRKKQHQRQLSIQIFFSLLLYFLAKSNSFGNPLFSQHVYFLVLKKCF